MPAKDKFFDAVIKALMADGWTITDEEFYLPFATRTAYIDILAEKPVTAEKEGRKIAVEVKPSVVRRACRNWKKRSGNLSSTKLP